MTNGDSELLRRYAADGDNDAFAEFVRQYIDLVYHSALRQVGGDTHAAEDVVQRVFILLAQKARALVQHPSLVGWLHTTTRNIAHDSVRAARRRQAREEEARLMHELSSPSAADSEWAKLRPVLDDTLAELPESDREAVLLRYFANLPLAAIGERLDISENAARMRIDRALDKLHARLSRRGITSTAAAVGTLLTAHGVGAAPAGLAASVTGSALGAATTAVGPALALLHLMSTSKIAVGGAAALLLLALGTTSFEIHAGRETNAALTDEQQQISRLSAESDDVRRRAIVVHQTVAELQRSIDAAQKAPSPAPRTVTTQTIDEVLAEGSAFAARHPELQRLFTELTRANIAGRFVPLFRMLSLTPAQIDRFTDLEILTGHWDRPDGQLIAIPGSDPARAQAQLRDLLGPDGFQQYEKFNRDVGPAWQLTIGIAGSLYRTSAPLTAEQGEALLQILVDGRRPVEWSSRPQYDWEAIVTNARNILSPVQLSALEKARLGDELSQAQNRARRALRAPAATQGTQSSPR